MAHGDQEVYAQSTTIMSPHEYTIEQIQNKEVKMRRAVDNVSNM